MKNKESRKGKGVGFYDSLLRICIFILGLAVIGAVPWAHAAHSPGSYPLIGWQTFGGAVDDFYARFDLISTRNRDGPTIARNCE